MSVKTYVLLEHTHASAQVYLQVNANQRIRQYKRPVDHAYGQITFMDRDGVNRTLRLVFGCNEIDQDKQIKEFQIPANRKYTQAEMDARKFIDGVLVTANPLVQKYLEASPQFEDNWIPEKDPKGEGRVVQCPELRQPLYRLYDETVQLKTDDAMFMLRVRAANKIAGINDVRSGQELLYRLFGAAHKAPNDILKVRQQLIDYLDGCDTDKELNELLKEDINQDEQTEILIGKAIGMGLLDFDKEDDQVVRIDGKKIIKLKQIPSEYAPEERRRYFSVFLTSPEGKLVKEDLEKAIKEGEKKKVVEKEAVA